MFTSFKFKFCAFCFSALLLLLLRDFKEMFEIFISVYISKGFRFLFRFLNINGRSPKIWNISQLNLFTVPSDKNCFVFKAFKAIFKQSWTEIFGLARLSPSFCSRITYTGYDRSQFLLMEIWIKSFMISRFGHKKNLFFLSNMAQIFFVPIHFSRLETVYSNGFFLLSQFRPIVELIIKGCEWYQ